MNRNLSEIKESINMHVKRAKIEKDSILESIEMFWLNADIQRKKTEIIIPESSKDNITRIRQLLAAAWSEDYK
ncbi:MAG: hypothetical protein CMP37_00195 [Rickettsiales bacterium]|jgi:hypothetical protein|nr:hypothetical protein [Rickettsiales bacterium]OUW73174.1 MAG: hypothetical protein CBD71_00235 [Rickettsiales bacterium TMED211]|tara:strand:- start:397 stop:615 length:219 start_codon:yes stop_codon:yes gene_type:complete